jgi:hypothetical protein
MEGWQDMMGGVYVNRILNEVIVMRDVLEMMMMMLWT